MKRCACAGLLLLATATGCVMLPKTFPAHAPRGAQTDAEAVKAKRPPAVTADQVTESNAREMSQALMDELNREAPAVKDK